MTHMYVYQQVHYVDMSNYVRRISKDAKDFEQLPEFIKNLANLVFLMNDKKGKYSALSFLSCGVSIFYQRVYYVWWLADGKWDMEEYRNGAVGWCRYVTGISEIDAAYESLLTVRL